jgi:uncharacterized LabA/DUF88 family protein
MQEPQIKKVVAFFDGQNLFHSAREAFGCYHPNYDVLLLSRRICSEQGWDLAQVRFYTGVPDKKDNALWNYFWHNKLLAMRRQGVHVFSRPLRYRNKKIKLGDGSTFTTLVGEEKGIDVRIAIDVVSMSRRGDFDVGLIFSQDQDLSEVADEVRSIAQEKQRWIKLVSAFPVSPTRRNKRGINKTDWLPIDRALYEKCIDHRDYRPKRTGK